MDKELKKELYRYCELRYERNVKMLSDHENRWRKSGNRPKSVNGVDMIDRTKKEILKYHSGMINFSK